MSKFASRGFWKQEINQSTSFKIGIFLSKSCHKYEFPEWSDLRVLWTWPSFLYCMLSLLRFVSFEELNGYIFLRQEADEKSKLTTSNLPPSSGRWIDTSCLPAGGRHVWRRYHIKDIKASFQLFFKDKFQGHLCNNELMNNWNNVTTTNIREFALLSDCIKCFLALKRAFLCVCRWPAAV